MTGRWRAVGARCQGGKLEGLEAGEVWEADAERGQMVLRSCPAGFQLVNAMADGTFSHPTQHVSP